MATPPVDQLLEPLSEASPCGDDLEYDPAFIALDAAAAGRPEQQYGGTVIPAQDPDWSAVYEQALAVSLRTRDLRVAVLLARAAARAHGVCAYAEGLALIPGLLERYWLQLHPRLEAVGAEHDATMRLNALAPLAHAAAGLADLRSARVGSGRSAVTVRQIELAFGRVEVHDGESALPRDGVLKALHDAQGPEVLAALQRLPAELARIESVLAKQAGAAGPDLRPLHTLTECLASAARLAGGAQPSDAAAPAMALADASAATSAGGPIGSRDDAIRILDRVCEWVERNEPANPAPLLIRRAQRLMNKNFLEIIRDLVPDGLDQVTKIAGTTAE